ncbi:MULTISPECIES: adenosine kinase [Henriciella]|jgi:sugar/nucleoside kinase (ribokinase family)|uniref:Adenosine kinase n=1 Tax=Henriciella pelagia TaxID=1977912 RepID=A0ABQ1JQT8_9PROT|nr:adenosine kinase [Henriciella pelagia]GGB72293.1 adenosine kinase [Henriciella pelagia]
MAGILYDVVGLGNAIVDIIAPVEDSFLDRFNIRKNGMTLIDEARADALTAAAPEARQLSGGSGANTIVGVASFGGTAAYIGKVADDPLGSVFRRDMNESGIPFDTPPLDHGPATARSIIFVTPDGARSMNTYLGASVRFSAEDVSAETVKAGAILYLEGYLFDEEPAKQAFVHASEIARAAGRRVALTLSDSFCVERHRDSFLHLIRNHVDILFANEDELLSLYQTDDFDGAVEKLRADTALAAVTRSEKGSVVIGEGEPIHVAAEPVDKVVDTTGAGDQYAAGFMFGLSRELPLSLCARLGHIAAAEVISHYGPRPEVAYRRLARSAGITN